MGNIQFLPLREDHIPLLRQWLKEPHVAEFWQETEDAEEFKKKFLEKNPERGISSFIITLKKRPIGYIQYYAAQQVGGGWWPDAQEGTYGIDQFIGDSVFINRGYGTHIIQEFVSVFFKNPKIKEIITDSSPKNLRAIRVYEKVGFKVIGNIQTPGGEALLLHLERSNN